MSKMGDNWAVAHKNWNAIFTAGFMCILLIWLIILDHTNPTFLNKYSLNMTVVSIKAHLNEKTNKVLFYLVELKSNDKKHITTVRAVKLIPKVGDVLPIIVEVYDDGSKLYYVDKHEIKNRELGI